MGKEENQGNYTVQADESFGQVQIADEVVAIIAGLAATEIEGVASMAGNITNELVSKLGMKKLSKGVKVVVTEGVVNVDVAINISYGYSVPDKVKSKEDPGKTRYGRVFIFAIQFFPGDRKSVV